MFIDFHDGSSLHGFLRHIAVLAIFAILTSCNVIQDINRNIGEEGGISTQMLIGGLKEALSVGTENSVNRLSKLGGFNADKALRIAVPSEIKSATDTLRKVGLGTMVDSFEDKMNGAAESASASATPVFMKAIREMTFDDARKILDGPENAATEYFRRSTGEELKKLFMPLVRENMNKVGLVQAYNGLMDRYNAIPLTSKPKFDLDNYIADKTLDGLFSVIASEEAEIRWNPAARTSDLLRKVFAR